ncbi:MAG: hypothetical protein LBC87_09260 [Fibromonadaceae bacterium]|jgi:hypothetical protein|nr:hypothetical protein [Fibromonadaceae bacterium]
MNIFKLPAICLLVATAAFAQAVPKAPTPAAAPVAAPVPPPPPPPPQAVVPAAPPPPQAVVPVAPAPAPAPIQFTVPTTDPAALVATSSSSEVATSLPVVSSSSAAAVREKTIFDNVRGNAYNPFGTVGAASTVRDLVEKPADIYGNKFFYISPVTSVGYTAVPLGSGSALIGLDNAPVGNLAALVFGYANSSFGFALNYSVNKAFASQDKLSTRRTSAGDNIELYFSSGAFYANAGWLTYGQSYSADYDGDTESQDYSQIEGTVGLTGKSGSFDYDGYVNVIRTGGTGTDSDGNKYADNSSTQQNTFLGLAVNLDLGFNVFQSPNARVIFGSNNRVFAMLFDNVKSNDYKGDTKMGLVISPNILGEFALTETLLAFAGASNAIDVVIGDGDGNGKTSALGIAHTPGTGAYVGLRYQKANLALEAQVTANMFDNPFGGFNGSNMFAGFGGFVYF